MSEFEKTAAEKTDVNDIIEISDTEKKNNSTIVSMKKISISFKHKTLNLIALKLLKYVQISKQSISTSVKTDDEIKTSHSTPAKMINKAKMSSV
ncbi:hypothetical protein BDBG_17756 [Blastomyces gilchristii SLH14081]|uniref:Uncharacterized protein n=1 Tax=Blastomyces gilchristii (strain SLH14081) TaxID=559298 RepID=A0A179V3Q5_BLAGS|nr:uncharacterized protein BDBG_17756 [Blastomyces gilchristii SLH14081]OAT13232.1 hypothetical protein BDBG_17756 [Blastomyces gilchristii SLH14081]